LRDLASVFSPKSKTPSRSDVFFTIFASLALATVLPTALCCNPDKIEKLHRGAVLIMDTLTRFLTRSTVLEKRGKLRPEGNSNRSGTSAPGSFVPRAKTEQVQDPKSRPIISGTLTIALLLVEETTQESLVLGR